MRTDTNSYIYIFAILMALVLSVLLALSETLLKPLKQEHVQQEKMQNILKTIGVEVPPHMAEENYNRYIRREIVLDAKGNIINGLRAFDIDLHLETRKPIAQQHFPMYVAEKQEQRYYIIPLRGSGLWDAIWGYIALDSEFNEVQGVIFDHKAETPGLGAEITKSFFTEAFKGKRLFDKEGKFVSIQVVKKGKSLYGQEHTVDAISGATITSEGVMSMLRERLSHYLDFIRSVYEAGSIAPLNRDVLELQ